MTTGPAEFANLPPTLKAERHGTVAVIKLARAAKRNALDDPTVQGLEIFFTSLTEDIRAVVLAGEGDHFSAGLDLTELTERDGRTDIRYAIDAVLAGKLGSIGQPVLKAKAKEMEKQFAERLQAAFAEAAS